MARKFAILTIPFGIFCATAVAPDSIYQQTANQTTEEVATDLGNLWIMTICAIHDGDIAGGNDILRYSRDLMPNIKVLRLIEEGREKPELVSSLLKKVIADNMGGYETIRKDWEVEWSLSPKWPAAVIAENDPFYEKNRHYEHPKHEFQRLHYSVYASFYVLANIQRLDADLLVKWIKVDKPWRNACIDMDVWLIDAYFRQGDATSEAASAYRAKTRAIQIGGQSIQRPRWRTFISGTPPYGSGPREGKLAKLPAIEILRVPRKMPENMSEELKNRIVRDFVRLKR